MFVTVVDTIGLLLLLTLLLLLLEVILLSLTPLQSMEVLVVAGLVEI
jgi:hypothetical protein